MAKPLNLLAFLLGLSLAFVPFTYAESGEFVEIAHWDGGDTSYTCAINGTASTPVLTTASAQLGYIRYSSWHQQGTSNNGAGWYKAVSVHTFSDHHDCYYYYAPDIQDPDHCSDGQQSGDETGIDCGGECSAECQTVCGAGYTLVYPVDIPEGTCVSVTNPNAFGECPAGYASYSAFYGLTGDYGGDCIAFGADPVLVSPAVLDNNPPELDSAPTVFSNGTFSVVQTPEIVTDNGDGTETATITTTKTNPDGSTSNSTTSVKRPSGSVSGTGFTGGGSGGVGVAAGYDGTESGDVPSEGVAGSGGTAQAFEMDTLEEETNRFKARLDEFWNAFENNPFHEYFLGVFTMPDGTEGDLTPTLNAGSYGSFDVDLAPSDLIYNVLKTVILLLALFKGASILVLKQG